jgi:hypothetical protein
MARQRVYNRGMEDVPENGKESSHSGHANGMNEYSVTVKPHIHKN